jgi:hypothetical protein
MPSPLHRLLINLPPALTASFAQRASAMALTSTHTHTRSYGFSNPDEESSHDQGEGYCACKLPEADVMTRMKKYVLDLRRADDEREEAARLKDKASEG